jgi:hypothetical protein
LTRPSGAGEGAEKKVLRLTTCGAGIGADRMRFHPVRRQDTRRRYFWAKENPCGAEACADRTSTPDSLAARVKTPT